MGKFVMYLAGKPYVEFADELTMSQWYDNRFKMMRSRGRRRKNYKGEMATIKTMIREYFPAQIHNNGKRTSLYLDFIDETTVFDYQSLPREIKQKINQYSNWFDKKLIREVEAGVNLEAMHPTTRGQARDCFFLNEDNYIERGWKKKA